MLGRITPEFKERLLSRVDIVDVVGLRVPLKKAGGLYKACCPFHDEKTPSFVVTPERQTYHCFGCGAHGNAIDFLIEYDRLSYPEAVQELARRAGMELPQDDGPGEQGPDLGPIYAALEQAAQLYRRQLREHPQARRAIDYLKGRGLSGEIVQRFGLGYAPPGWDFLLRHCDDGTAGHEHLVSAGLLADKDGRHYDRFRDRVMFPIHDRRGRVVGFGGRVLGDGEPKYLNSPETPVFHKGSELYGLYQAQQVRRRPPRLLVVEGYMDVIALAQFEIPYTVATLGTATTPQHVQRLLRAAPELAFCFDGDRAGRAAAWKALQTTLPLADGGQPVRFLFLPDGEDPDSLVRAEGREAFERRVASAKLMSEVLFDEAGARHDTRTAEGRAALADEIKALLKQMPPGSYREQLYQELRRRTSVLGGRPMPRSPGASTRPRGAARARREERPLRNCIALVLDDPARAQIVAEMPRDWEVFASTETRALAELLGTLVDRALAYPGRAASELCADLAGDGALDSIRAELERGRFANDPPQTRGQMLRDALGRLNDFARRELAFRGRPAAHPDPPADEQGN